MTIVQNEAKWTNRFLIVSVIQGAIATFLTILLALFIISTSYAEHLVSKLLDDPSIGFIEITALAGLGVYFLIGVLGNGVLAFIYHYFESLLKKNFHNLSGVLASSHLILTNIGVSSVSIIMIYAGYLGDTAVFSQDIAGFGMSPDEVSQNMLNHFIVPIGIMLLVSSLGAICGGIVFIIEFIKK